MATRKKKTTGSNLHEGLSTINLFGQTFLTWKAILIGIGLLGAGAFVVKQVQNPTPTNSTYEQNEQRKSRQMGGQ